jgi:hypothetical protein
MRCVTRSHALRAQPDNCFANLDATIVGVFGDVDGAVATSAQMAQLNTGCAGMAGAFLGAIDNNAVAALPVACVANLTAGASAGVTASQAPALTDEQLAVLSATATAALAPAAVGALSATQFDAFAYASTYAMTAAQLGALAASVCAQIAPSRTTFFSGAACAGLSTPCVLALPSYAGLTGACVAAQQTPIATNATNAQLLSLSAAGWQGVTDGALWTTLLSARVPAMLNVSAAALAQIAPAEIDAVTAIVGTQDLAHVTHNATDNVSAASWLVVSLWTNDSMAALTAAQLSALPTFSLVGVRPGQICNLTNDVVGALTSAECAALSASGVGGITNEQIYYVQPSAFVGFCSHINAFNDDAALNITSDQLVALGNSACDGDDVCALLHRISDHVVQSVTAANFVAKVTKCGLAGTRACVCVCVCVAHVVCGR